MRARNRDTIKILQNFLSNRFKVIKPITVDSEEDCSKLHMIVERNEIMNRIAESHRSSTHPRCNESTENRHTAHPPHTSMPELKDQIKTSPYVISHSPSLKWGKRQPVDEVYLQRCSRTSYQVSSEDKKSAKRIGCSWNTYDDDRE